MKVKLLALEKFDEFFIYLNDHLSDNGINDNPLFQPRSRSNLELSEEQMTSFKKGQSIPTDQLGWRRFWVATNEENEIIGHIDLRSHNQNHTSHRALLGMGVHRDYRKLGLGRLLIESVIEWAKSEVAIAAIDLWVLSENKPAIGLYEKMGFKTIGEVEDMFRIENTSYDYRMMAITIA